jgi:hypothetical protein
LVYIYTNLRVLNQNVTFTDEAATKWYKQSIVHEDSNYNRPTNLFHEYDGLSDVDTPNAKMDDAFIDNENRASIHCVVLPCSMDEINAKKNTHVLGMETIKLHDAPSAGL